MTADDRLGRLVDGLDGHTAWTLVDEVPLAFDAHHPQGLAPAPGGWWLTSVEVDPPTGHLFHVGVDGSLLADVRLGDGTRVHPGGCWPAPDGALWLAVAEYRPHSSTDVVRVEPAHPEPVTAFRIDDHLGLLLPLDDRLVGATWGGRHFVHLRTDGARLGRWANPQHLLDWQDGQPLGDGSLLLTGVAALGVPPTGVGGLGRCTPEGVPSLLVPVAAASPRSGRPATFNATTLEVVDGDLVLRAVPDDGRGALLTFVARRTGSCPAGHVP